MKNIIAILRDMFQGDKEYPTHPHIEDESEGDEGIDDDASQNSSLFEDFY